MTFTSNKRNSSRGFWYPLELLNECCSKQRFYAKLWLIEIVVLCSTADVRRSFQYFVFTSVKLRVSIILLSIKEQLIPNLLDGDFPSFDLSLACPKPPRKFVLLKNYASSESCFSSTAPTWPSPVHNLLLRCTTALRHFIA